MKFRNLDLHAFPTQSLGKRTFGTQSYPPSDAYNFRTEQSDSIDRLAYDNDIQLRDLKSERDFNMYVCIWNLDLFY